MFVGGDSNAGPASNLLIDFFEDNMLEEVGSADSKDDEENFIVDTGKQFKTGDLASVAAAAT